MNLGQMQTAVYNRLSVDSSDALLTPATIQDFINQANHQISGLHDWPWLQTQEVLNTVAGTAFYVPGAAQVAPFSGWYRTIEIRDQNARVLERYSITELDDRWDPTAQGWPMEWAIYADQIHLRPIPGGVYAITHRYIYMEPDLVNSTDTPVLPTIHHFAIVELATYLALRRDRNDARAAAAEQAFEMWKTEQLNRAMRRYDVPGRIRVRPGGWLGS